MTNGIVRWADTVASPWKNGGGVTRQLLSVPPAAEMGEFDWRISVADIEASGEFSRFDGVQRVFTVVEGGPLDLVVDGDTRAVPLRMPFAFSGAASVTCVLRDGHARALNVMTREGRCRAQVSVVSIHGVQELEPRAGHEVVLVVLAGEVTVSGGEHEARLTAYDLVRVDAMIALSGDGECAVIDIAR